MNNPSPDPLFHKPAGIVAAKNLLYTAMFLDIVIWTLGRWSWGNGPAFTTMGTTVTLIVSLVLLYVLTKCITRGMKWARLVLLVLFLLALIPLIWTFGIVWRASPLIAVLSLLPSILEAFAVGFVFKQESTLWFDRVEEKFRDEPHT